MAVAERCGAPEELITVLREAHEADIGPEAVEIFQMLTSGDGGEMSYHDKIAAVIEAVPEVCV